MKIKLVLAIITINFVGAGILVSPSQAAKTTIEQMPAKLETQFALSAVPPALRDQATVYLLDPGKGYQLARQGTSGVTCLVERTVWEWVDFRNDIYIPLCYDAVGTKAHLKVIMDTATLRAEGSYFQFRLSRQPGPVRDASSKARSVDLTDCSPNQKKVNATAGCDGALRCREKAVRQA